MYRHFWAAILLPIVWAVVCWALGISSEWMFLGWLIPFAVPLVSLLPLSDAPWIIRTVGFFRRDLRPVVLYHWKGPQEPLIYSLARYNRKTNLWQCPVYWSTNVGFCVLKPNGLVTGLAGPSYIMYWRPLRKTELMTHLFTEVEHVWGEEAVKRYQME